MEVLLKCSPSPKKHLFQLINSIILLVIIAILVVIFQKYGLLVPATGAILSIMIITKLFITYLYTNKFIIEVTRYSVEFRYGIFSRQSDSIEMHKINDFSQNQSFFDNLLGLSTLVIYSTDKTSPKKTFSGLLEKDADKFFELLQLHSSDSLVKHFNDNLINKN